MSYKIQQSPDRDFKSRLSFILTEFHQDKMISLIQDSLKLRRRQKESRLRIINFRRKKT